MAERKLEVYLHGRRSGVLYDNDGVLSFIYDSSADTPLTVRMPLREQPYTDKDCRVFFENLLPEGEIRGVVAVKERVSEGNVFSLLEKIGGECAGAVSLYEEGMQPVKGGETKPRVITDEALCAIIDSQKSSPLLTGNNIRLSLAGAQAKFAVYVDGGAVYYPDDKHFSSHLVKPGNSIFEGIAVNEYFCMRLAALMGLTVAATEIKSVNNRSYIIVDRFDRMIKEGKRRRLHQEDFCQALGRTPDRKYQKEGGPGIKECFKFLEGRAGIAPLERLLSVFVFNYLIGNCDAHAKNFSVLHDVDAVSVKDGKLYALENKGGITPAPFYDLVSTEVYDALSKEMAMKIGAAWDIREVQKTDFYKAAAELNVREKEVDSLIESFSEIKEKAAIVISDIEQSGFDAGICRRISEGIKKRYEKLSGGAAENRLRAKGRKGRTNPGTKTSGS